MSHPPSTHSATESLPDKLDLQMLHGAQEHLRRRQGHQKSSDCEDRAWRWFYDTYGPFVRRYVLAHALPKDDVADCMQDVWNEVVKSLGTFDSDGTQGRLCAWLRQIVHSKATDLLRHRARHACKHLCTQAEAGLTSREAGPVADYEQHCRHEAVERILAKLRQRVNALSYRAFTMHWLQMKSIKRIVSHFPK